MLINEKFENKVNLIEAFFTLFLESVSLIDNFTDFQILVAFYNNNHNAWATLTLLCMTAPYLIGLSPMISFFIYRGTFEVTDN